MPVTLKSAHVKYKDSDGHYVGINSVSDNTTAEQVAQIQSAGTTQVNAVAAKGAQTLASIPQDYTTLSNDVGDLKSAITYTLDNTLLKRITPDLPVVTLELLDCYLQDNDVVVTGTNNVIDILELAQGTYTERGVTIKATGNTFEITGTATQGMYYCLTTGERQTSTELGQMTLNLPVHFYTLSEKVETIASGTSFPPLFIRSKVSGNAVSTQNNTAQFTMDTSVHGGLYFNIENGKTYNCKIIVALFPYAATNATKYRDQTSAVQVINTTGIYKAQGYTWASGTPDVKILQSRIPKKPKCIYSTRQIEYSGMAECLDVYIPAQVGYVDYIFGRTQTLASQAEGGGNVWRLVEVDAVDEGFLQRFKITQLGETEMAIKIFGRDDFIGGSTHGDEWMDANSLLFVIDGLPVDITTVTEMRDFTELKCFLVSNLYDPNDHTTLVGIHSREWVFNADGLYIGQIVEFKENLTMTESYMPMICALRGNDTASALLVTDTYVDDGNYQRYDIGTAGFTTYPNQLKRGIRKVNLFGHESGVDITVDYIEFPDNLRMGGNFTYNVINTYNKIYNCLCGYGNSQANTQEVSAGDKWIVKAQLKINVGK